MDVLYRYVPQSRDFEIYPLPTRSVTLRDLAFAPSGEVCSSYSSLPQSQMPDPAPKLMCLSTAN
jgi:hypothetical protein